MSASARPVRKYGGGATGRAASSVDAWDDPAVLTSALPALAAVARKPLVSRPDIGNAAAAPSQPVAPKAAHPSVAALKAASSRSTKGAAAAPTPPQAGYSHDDDDDDDGSTPTRSRVIRETRTLAPPLHHTGGPGAHLSSSTESILAAAAAAVATARGGGAKKRRPLVKERIAQSMATNVKLAAVGAVAGVGLKAAKQAAAVDTSASGSFVSAGSAAAPTSRLLRGGTGRAAPRGVIVTSVSGNISSRSKDLDMSVPSSQGLEGSSCSGATGAGAANDSLLALIAPKGEGFSETFGSVLSQDTSQSNIDSSSSSCSNSNSGTTSLVLSGLDRSLVDGGVLLSGNATQPCHSTAASNVSGASASHPPHSPASPETLPVISPDSDASGSEEEEEEDTSTLTVTAAPALGAAGGRRVESKDRLFRRVSMGMPKHLLFFPGVGAPPPTAAAGAMQGLSVVAGDPTPATEASLTATLCVNTSSSGGASHQVADGLEGPCDASLQPLPAPVSRASGLFNRRQSVLMLNRPSLGGPGGGAGGALARPSIGGNGVVALARPSVGGSGAPIAALTAARRVPMLAQTASLAEAAAAATCLAPPAATAGPGSLSASAAEAAAVIAQARGGMPSGMLLAAAAVAARPVALLGAPYPIGPASLRGGAPMLPPSVPLAPLREDKGEEGEEGEGEEALPLVLPPPQKQQQPHAIALPGLSQGPMGLPSFVTQRHHAPHAPALPTAPLLGGRAGPSEPTTTEGSGAPPRSVALLLQPRFTSSTASSAAKKAGAAGAPSPARTPRMMHGAGGPAPRGGPGPVGGRLATSRPAVGSLGGAGPSNPRPAAPAPPAPKAAATGRTGAAGRLSAVDESFLSAFSSGDEDGEQEEGGSGSVSDTSTEPSPLSPSLFSPLFPTGAGGAPTTAAAAAARGASSSAVTRLLAAAAPVYCSSSSTEAAAAGGGETGPPIAHPAILTHAAAPYAPAHLAAAGQPRVQSPFSSPPPPFSSPSSTAQGCGGSDDETMAEEGAPGSAAGVLPRASSSPSEGDRESCPVTQGLAECLSVVLSFLPSRELLNGLPLVAKDWHRVAATVYSWRIAEGMTPESRAVEAALEAAAAAAATAAEDAAVLAAEAAAAAAQEDSASPQPQHAAAAAAATTAPVTTRVTRRTGRGAADSAPAPAAALEGAAGRRRGGRATAVTAGAGKEEDGSDANDLLSPLLANLSLGAPAAGGGRRRKGVPPPGSAASAAAAASALAQAKRALAVSAEAAAAPSRLLLRPPWAPFLSAFPWGAFLSAGAYKQVYRVWNRALGRVEAVSVMDVGALAATEGLPIVLTEIQTTCLVAELARTGVSPHFLEAHQSFLLPWAPHAHFPQHWGCEGNPAPWGRAPPFRTGPSFAAASLPPLRTLEDAQLLLQRAGAGTSSGSGVDPLTLAAATLIVRKLGSLPPPPPAGGAGAQAPGEFLYIRMELCAGGDLEAYLRRVEPLVAAAEAAAGAEAAAAAAVRPAAAASTSVSSVMAAVGGRRPIKAASALPPPSPEPPASSSSGTDAVAAGGPAAAHLRAVDAATATFALHSLFQMCHGFYAARERLTLRHYDVKLLNFLVKPAGDAISDGVSTMTAAAAPTHRSGSSPAVRVVTPGPAPQLAPPALRIEYAFADRLFAVQLPTAAAPPPRPSSQSPLPLDPVLSSGMVVKLADFGTADSEPGTLGQPLRNHNLTTLENTALEALVLGDGAAQSYGFDTWALGLCALHLLTGCAPYEEVMAEVTCPPALRAALVATWRAGAGGKVRGKKAAAAARGSGGPPAVTYRVLAPLVEEEEEGEEAGGVLPDTLWRVLVLCDWEGEVARLIPYAPQGASGDGGEGRTGEVGVAAYNATNPIWGLLLQALCTLPSPAAPTPSTPGEPAPAAAARRKKAAAPTPRRAAPAAASPALDAGACPAIRAAFEADKARFSLARGSAPLMVRARRRLALLPGLAPLLSELLCLHPAGRCSMKRALLSPAFEPLRVVAVAGGSAGGNGASVAYFPAYESAGGEELADV